MKKRYFFLPVFFTYALLPVQAQILYSNGATVHINSGATVMANGGVHVANASAFTNDGTLTITKNSTLPIPGTLQMTSAAIIDGNGSYNVEQDWINDATFNAGSSIVTLNGNTQQFITSTTGIATTFNNLTLTGAGSGTNRKKTLQNVDASTGTNGTLAINDRELETQTHTFFVLNSSTAAVSNSTTPGSEGFVSSTALGTLSRATNTAAAYLFPTGSSTGTLRYRPAELTPNSAVANVYTVRLNNVDANTDGFNRASNDGSMCIINNLYYHSIDRTAGTTPADIRLFYIASADGNWSGMGHWKSASSAWNNMNTVTPATSGIFSTLDRAAWAFADPGHPYALINPRPAQPSITCPTAVCENSPGNVFTATGAGGSTLQWSVPSGSTIQSGQGTTSMTAAWGTVTGYVHVYAVGSPGCNSLPDSCQPTVFPSPVAAFSTSSTSTYGDSYSFNNTSTGGTNWLWEFGDGSSATQQNTSHQYTGAGTYTVTMIVSNAGGCTDTMSIVINSAEGISIPNIFSPNGDGINDEFYVTASNLKEYDLSIYNRWGELMFHSDSITQKWDGTNNGGKACPNGTYFFVLKANSNTKDYSTSGYVAIAGSK